MRDASGYPSRPYAWTVVAILIATAVLSYTDRQVLSLLVDPIRGELGISDTQVSLLLGTAFAVVYGIAGIPLGFLADRTSRRNLIFAGVVVWSCGTLACGFSHSFGQLFAARIVVGLGEAVLSPAAISLISDYFPPARRGTAVGFFLSGIAMGIGAAILIGGGVLHVVESGVLAGTPFAGQPAWRLVLLLIGAPGLLWSLAILLIKEPARKTTEDGTATATRHGGHRREPPTPTPTLHTLVPRNPHLPGSRHRVAGRQRRRRLGPHPADPRIHPRPRADRRAARLPAHRRLRRRRVIGRLVSRSRRQPRWLLLQTGSLPPFRPPDPPRLPPDQRQRIQPGLAVRAVVFRPVRHRHGVRLLRNSRRRAEPIARPRHGDQFFSQRRTRRRPGPERRDGGQRLRVWCRCGPRTRQLH